MKLTYHHAAERLLFLFYSWNQKLELRVSNSSLLLEQQQRGKISDTPTCQLEILNHYLCLLYLDTGHLLSSQEFFFITLREKRNKYFFLCFIPLPWLTNPDLRQTSPRADLVTPAWSAILTHSSALLLLPLGCLFQQASTTARLLSPQ